MICETVFLNIFLLHSYHITYLKIKLLILLISKISIKKKGIYIKYDDKPCI